MKENMETEHNRVTIFRDVFGLSILSKNIFFKYYSIENTYKQIRNKDLVPIIK